MIDNHGNVQLRKLIVLLIHHARPSAATFDRLHCHTLVHNVVVCVISYYLNADFNMSRVDEREI
jgi:hypothetical protein